MSALSKLVVGNDAGTSRPVTAQHTRPASSTKQSQQNSCSWHDQAQHALHDLGVQSMQAASDMPNVDTWASQTALSSCVHKQGSPNPGTGTAACRQHDSAAHKLSQGRVQAVQRQRHEQMLSIPSPALAAGSGPAHAPAAAPASRPVTPHITKPYKAMPALESILQQSQSSRHSDFSRPATAAGRLITPPIIGVPYAASSSMWQPGTWNDSRAAADKLRSRPSTASSSYVQYPGADLEAWRCSKGSALSVLRPGSAAAAKILRAMDKAVVATPHTACARSAGRRQPGKTSRHINQRAQQLGVELCQAQQEQQLMWPPAETDAQEAFRAATAAQCNSSGVSRPGALTKATLLAAHDSSTPCQAAAAAEGRPTTAVMHSVLAAAARPEDGVDTRLAAIRKKNSTFDHSADLDIVDADDDEYMPGCGDSPCGVLNKVAAGVGTRSETAAAVTVTSEALGRQAAAMVLNLDDLTQCTPEVLEIELESMDVEQLLSLKHVLFDAAGGF